MKDTLSELPRIEMRLGKQVMGIGEIKGFRAFAIYSDGSEKDVTNESERSIEDPNIAEIVDVIETENVKGLNTRKSEVK